MNKLPLSLFLILFLLHLHAADELNLGDLRLNPQLKITPREDTIQILPEDDNEPTAETQKTPLQKAIEQRRFHIALKLVDDTAPAEDLEIALKMALAVGTDLLNRPTKKDLENLIRKLQKKIESPTYSTRRKSADKTDKWSRIDAM